MTTAIENQVVLNKARHRFELPIDVGADALAYYREDDEGRLVLIHTEVPAEFSGQGLGSRLAHGVFDIAREQGLKLVLKCPFMSGWFARHPDYGDVVGG